MIRPSNYFINTLAKIEKGFNYAGYVPGLSTLSGATRWCAGMIEAIIGLALATFFMFGKVFVTNEKRVMNFTISENYAMEFARNGLGNVARAYIEIIPLINMTTLINDRKWKARMRYRNETVRFP